MKVLSIKEPYATLIANGAKKIETRSWRTNIEVRYLFMLVRKNLIRRV